IVNLTRIRGKIQKLAAGYRPAGVWADYTRSCTYDTESEQAKKALVKRFLEIAQPAHVLDVGCNTGDYSFPAAETGARVTAVDGDHDAVEILYRRLKQKPARITPMVGQVANPSPGIGYMNTERSPFLERAKSDCVMALALIHHLLVSANLSLAAI